MKYLLVMFCFLSTMSFAQRSKKQVNSAVSTSVQLSPAATGTDADQILQIILTDFAAQLAESSNKPTTVILLDTYNELVGKRYTINGVNFVAGGKPEILANNGVSAAFWRLDISSSNAHIEFYYTDSKNQTIHKEYKLTKVNATWRK